MSEKIKKVAIVGMGVIGAQIAIQTACHEYDVVGFDEFPESFDKANQFIFASIAAQKMEPVMGLEVWKQGLARVRMADSLQGALAEADLVIEAVPERLELKREVFAKLDRLAPKHAILASNSSSMPISKLEDTTQRPGQCLNLHFYFPALGINLVDVMGGSQTSAEIMDQGVAWVRSIGCIPLRLHKETFGFCLNRIQHAARREALHMWANGSVDLADMDRAWMVWTGMPFGPFGMMDQVGLDVVYNVEMSYFKETGDPRFEPPEALRQMIEKGELGSKTGKGFYDYPDPAYRQPDFLSGAKDD